MPAVQETTALSVYQPYPSPSSAPLNYGFENLFSSDASVHVQLEHLNRYPYQPQDINFPSLVTSHNQCSLSAPPVPSPSSAPLNYGFENLFSSDASVHVQLEHLNRYPYQPRAQDINFPSLVTSHNQCSLSAPPVPSPSSVPLNYGFENLFSSDASVHVQLEHLNRYPYQPRAQDINFPSLVTSHNQCSLSALPVPVLVPTAQSSHSFFTCSRGFQPLSPILPPSRSPPSAAVSNKEQPRKHLRYPCKCPNCKNGVNSKLYPTKNRHNCHYPGCINVYGRTAHLRRHLQTHTRFICPEYGGEMRFTRSDYLNRHIKTHQKKSSGDPNSNAKNKDPSPSSASEI